jgi:hypothetical protein
MISTIIGSSHCWIRSICPGLCCSAGGANADLAGPVHGGTARTLAVAARGVKSGLDGAAWSDADGRALADSLGGRSVVHAVEWTLTQQRVGVQDESPLSSSELR